MSSRILALIDPKLASIVKIFLEREDELFHLKKISQDAKVPIGTTFRLIAKLTDSGLVETIVVGKVKLYRLNKANAKEFEALK